MNKGLLAFNIVLLLAVGVLFFLFFTRNNKTGNTIIRQPGTDTAAAWEHTPVAYFDMDSIESNFVLWKQTQDEMMKKEQAKNDTINFLKMQFQNYLDKMQEQYGRLSPAQKDSVNLRVQEMDNNWKNRAAEINQGYQTYYMSKQQEIVTLIKNYCKEFNKDRRFSYIIAREPGLFYYTDTAYNITSELLKDLNAFYAKKNK